MTNDELKKKIVEILCKVWIEPVPCTAERKFEHVADALIAAGIGDVSKWKAYAKVHRIVITKDDKIKQLYSDEEVDKIVIERAEYKHRAEVAEMALDKATELAYTYRTQDDTLSCSSCPFDSIFDRCKERGLYEDCSKRWKEELLQQAEKELAEEEKDD